MNKKYKEVVTYVGCILGALIGLLFLRAVVYSTEGSMFYGFSDSYTKTYIIGMIISFVIFICICGLGYVMGKNTKLENLVVKYISDKVSFILGIAAILLVWGVVGLKLFNMFYDNQDQYSCFTYLPTITTVVIITVIIIIAYIGIIKGQNQKLNIVCYIVYALSALSNAIYLGISNTMAGSGYSLYHNNAFNQTIYNVYYNTPYNSETMGVYGHYALFFKLPMQIFGTSPLVIGICIAIGGFLFVMFCCMAIHWLIDSNVIRLLTALGIVFFENGIQDEVYWMNVPLRWLFPSALLCYGAFLIHKGLNYRLKHFIIGCIICSVGVLFNLESGMICCLCWAFYCLIRIAQENKLTLRLAVQSIAIQLCAIVLEVVAAIQIVNIYNFIVTGFDWSQLVGIHGFFFPVIGSSLVSATQTPLLWGNYDWFYIYILFFGCCAWALFHMIKDNEGNSNPKAAVVGMTALCGIGLFTYYFNRTIAGTCICYLQVVLCNAWVADSMVSSLRKGFKEKKIDILDGIRIGTGGVALAVLCILLYAQPYAVKHYKAHLNSDLYNYTELQSYAEQIAEVVPEGTYAFGMGTAELYGQLGWDTKYHLRDFPNVEMLREDISSIQNAMLQEPYVFVEMAAYDYIPEGFELVQEFRFGNRLYGFYKNVN